MALRENFPIEGADYLGGYSDGWEYKTSFNGTTLDKTYEMVKAFLQEEGYSDIPIPSNAKELRLFKKVVPSAQMSIFREIGYIHNPIKILFHPNEKRKTSLTLCLYNESSPQHLLRFHGLV